jgi:hypothetical protein
VKRVLSPSSRPYVIRQHITAMLEVDQLIESAFRAAQVVIARKVRANHVVPLTAAAGNGQRPKYAS